MLDQEDLKWIASTSTNLNSMLQQIARYTDLARRHKGEHNYLDLVSERVELGTKTAQALFDRVTTKILAKAVAKSAAGLHPTFTVVPPPTTAFPTVAASPSRTLAALETKISESTLSVSAATAVEANSSQDIKIRNPKGNHECILIVEDDREVAELAAEMLTDEGYKVIVTRDGFEALEIYRKMTKEIGLVILDFFLPVIDGDAVFDELREINPKVNVVLSSGFAEQEKVSAMLAQGLRGFIPKPYTREKLLEQVRSTLDAARQATR